MYISVAEMDDLPSWRPNSIDNSHVSIKVESYDGSSCNDHGSVDNVNKVAQNEDVRNALLNKLNAINYGNNEKGRMSRTSSADN